MELVLYVRGNAYVISVLKFLQLSCGLAGLARQLMSLSSQLQQ